MENKVNNLIELLSIVAEEQLDCEIAEHLCGKISWSNIPELEDVYCNLFHYWHDEDIRERDQDYKSMQDSELLKLIHHLKNKEFEKACLISFLGATQDGE